ncbi:HAMP domain-containing sensor histidine kinase [Microlunatus panaciterrae]|uniref:Signal transduction histidine-protein kinase/phosphatase MprB n=1 Tax=Microlunatus panaciterrae TaxID=400768 RepID=A0ABS2RKC2_9ACTN|nr:ATP-binding protein [Microlunatus panaciterrae]MBM7798616.1 signal transduction histidine kinase [Microlunatus panaciterrae]
MSLALRPLDRFGSIKIKLGVLVAASVTVAAVFAAGGVKLGWPPHYTIPLAVLVALAVTQLLAHGMTAPLRQMTGAARAMAIGDYRQRVSDTSRDEVGELGRAFNRMATELAQVEQQRRELIANVSHELRTPISALHAVLENIVDGVSEPDEQTLRTALAQTERLTRLVTDLLDLSRVDAGIVPMAVEPISAQHLLDDAVIEASVGVSKVSYDVDVVPPTLVLTGDAERLRQLIANLLDNAGRHSPDGGVVTVRARAEGDGVVIDVLDEGPGIPPAERSAVFERFNSGRSARDGGTGLGLAIARWVVQLHNGSIAVADSPRGCDIRVTLPSPQGEAQ